jgi:hypothetical protein
MTLRTKTTAVLAMIGLLGLNSCLKKSDDVQLYSDTVITGFTLGTMNRYVDGVKSTFVGSAYPMNIDMTHDSIYNTTPLPYGTDLAHVLVTITTKNSGQPFIKRIDEDLMDYVSGTDSLDFTTTRIIRVVSTDGNHVRDYKVTLLVEHSAASDSAFAWERQAQWPAELEEQKDTLEAAWPYSTVGGVTYQLRVVTGADADSILWRRIVLQDGEGEWTLIPQEGENIYKLPAAQVKGLVSTVEPNVNPRRIVPVAILTDGSMLVSRDEGITWFRRDMFAMPKNSGQPSKVAQDGNNMVWLEDDQQRVWSSRTW